MPEDKIVMLPKPEFKLMNLESKILIWCRILRGDGDESQKQNILCQGLECCNCAFDSIGNYKKYKQQEADK